MDNDTCACGNYMDPERGLGLVHSKVRCVPQIEWLMTEVATSKRRLGELEDKVEDMRWKLEAAQTSKEP